MKTKKQIKIAFDKRLQKNIYFLKAKLYDLCRETSKIRPIWKQVMNFELVDRLKTVSLSFQKNVIYIPRLYILQTVKTTIVLTLAMQW